MCLEEGDYLGSLGVLCLLSVWIRFLEWGHPRHRGIEIKGREGSDRRFLVGSGVVMGLIFVLGTMLCSIEVDTGWDVGVRWDCSL
uniref:Transmembrane protein n=1 Tax=Fagus sylvatica TaxID=28930 RepID=A0A2N9GS83_FAGSY